MSIYIPSNNTGVTVSQLLAYNYVDQNKLNTNLATKPNFSGNASFQSATGSFANLIGGTGSFTNLTLTNSISTDPTFNTVKIGNGAGQLSGTSVNSVMLGLNSGYSGAGNNMVAIGPSAGAFTAANGTVLIGNQAGNQTAGFRATCIGTVAGFLNCGTNSVCLGYNAGYSNCPSNSLVFNAAGATENPIGANTITINATTSSINGATANALYVAPIQGRAAGKGVNVLCYDTTTKEIYYSTS